ncbi:MAG: DUF4924 family protein [Flavobacteriales bacterium]|nr:DUF4924 family protein [Flavobacteriales bacterium]
MTVAEQKKQENIAEYLLFVWQMEDLARAANFDPMAIRAMYETSPEEQKLEEVEWFKNLCKTMKREDLLQTGHIAEVREIIQELTFLHQNLMTTLNDEKYQALRMDAYPDLTEFLVRTQGKTKNEVEAYLTALYGWLILRLKGAEIGEATEASMKKFSKVVAYLSNAYKKLKSDEQNLGLN